MVKSESEKFIEMVEALALRFPVAEIAAKTGYGQADVSRFIKGKRKPSVKFMESFYSAFAEDLKAAGSNPVQSPGVAGSNPIKDSEDYQAKYIALLEQQLAQANTHLTQANEVIKTSLQEIAAILKNKK